MRAIDLFAGIGGIRLGFERAAKESLETVFVSEMNTDAQAVYQRNFVTPPPISLETSEALLLRTFHRLTSAWQGSLVKRLA